MMIHGYDNKGKKLYHMSVRQCHKAAWRLDSIRIKKQYAVYCMYVYTCVDAYYAVPQVSLDRGR